MSVAQTISRADTPGAPEPHPLPTLLGEGYGVYRTRPSAFVYSFALNIVLTTLLAWSAHWAFEHQEKIRHEVMAIVADVSPYVLPASSKQSRGGGGGGDRDKLAASKGVLPKQSMEQITPPMVVVRKEQPKLAADPTVVAPPIQISQMGSLGDPLSTVLGPSSSGPGFGGGIGTGSGGGIGSGHGPGVGPGSGGGIGGGVYRVGGGVSAPTTIYAPDPEYSEEARKAKYQGTVELTMIVGADGRPRDVRVRRSLGLGLDEKAIDAVKTWRFEPARKNGQAVAVLIEIEVSFRLY